MIYSQTFDDQLQLRIDRLGLLRDQLARRYDKDDHLSSPSAYTTVVHSIRTFFVSLESAAAANLELMIRISMIAINDLPVPVSSRT